MRIIKFSNAYPRGVNLIVMQRLAGLVRAGLTQPVWIAVRRVSLPAVASGEKALDPSEYLVGVQKNHLTTPLTEKYMSKGSLMRMYVKG